MDDTDNTEVPLGPRDKITSLAHRRRDLMVIRDFVDNMVTGVDRELADVRHNIKTRPGPHPPIRRSEQINGRVLQCMELNKEVEWKAEDFVPQLSITRKQAAEALKWLAHHKAVVRIRRGVFKYAVDQVRGAV